MADAQVRKFWLDVARILADFEQHRWESNLKWFHSDCPVSRFRWMRVQMQSAVKCEALKADAVSAVAADSRSSLRRKHTDTPDDVVKMLKTAHVVDQDGEQFSLHVHIQRAAQMAKETFRNDRSWASR